MLKAHIYAYHPFMPGIQVIWYIQTVRHASTIPSWIRTDSRVLVVWEANAPDMLHPSVYSPFLITYVHIPSALRTF